MFLTRQLCACGCGRIADTVIGRTASATQGSNTVACAGLVCRQGSARWKEDQAPLLFGFGRRCSAPFIPQKLPKFASGKTFGGLSR